MIQIVAAIFHNNSLPQTSADPAAGGNLTSILNIVFATMGAIAFFMIILAGFRYVTSGGEPDKVAGAKRTITYSIVGLVVIAMAATIVNFVVGRATQ